MEIRLRLALDKQSLVGDAIEGIPAGASVSIDRDRVGYRLVVREPKPKAVSDLLRIPGLVTADQVPVPQRR